MFEECFSMIELNSLVERVQAQISFEIDADPDYDFDELSLLLMSALDEALNQGDDAGSHQVH